MPYPSHIISIAITMKTNKDISKGQNDRFMEHILK
jgi:hypothetical protein